MRTDQRVPSRVFDVLVKTFIGCYLSVSTTSEHTCIEEAESARPTDQETVLDEAPEYSTAVINMSSGCSIPRETTRQRSQSLFECQNIIPRSVIME